MKVLFARTVSMIIPALIAVLSLGWAAELEEEKEVQQLIRKAEGCFVIGEDEEGFKVLDGGMKKYRERPAEGEFLYAKAMELCKYYREEAEKTEGRKLLREYVERFSGGRHFAKAVGEIARDLSDAEKEKCYRTIIRGLIEATERPWAMERLADLLAETKPEEALSLRKRIIEEHPRSGHAYQALSVLARQDFDAGRLANAADRLRKCLFDFAHLPCGAFGKEEELLARIVEKRPELKLLEGEPLPEYTPRWKEGECWEMEEGPVSPGKAEEWAEPFTRDLPTREIAGLRGLATSGAWRHARWAEQARTVSAYVGPPETRDGKLCDTIHRAGVPYAYSPELVLYLGRDSANFVGCEQVRQVPVLGLRRSRFDPFRVRRAGTRGPFFLPHFPLKRGKSYFRGGEHRIVQECWVEEGRVMVRLSHCGESVVMVFSKNRPWWDELRYFTEYFPQSVGPPVDVPTICRVTRWSRRDPSLNLQKELEALSLLARVEKAMHENKSGEMSSAGEELLTKFPEHRYGATYLEYVSRRGGDPASRESALDRLLRDYPDSPEAGQAKRRHVQNLKGEGKVKALQELINSESEPGAVMELRRQLLYALGEVGDDEGIVDEYERMEAEAGKTGAGDPRVRAALSGARWPAASSYYRLGQYEKAVELYRTVRKGKHILRACALVRLGRFKEAIEACEGDDSRSVEMVRAFAFYGMGDLQRAAAAFERLSFGKLDPQATTYLALLYGQMGKEEKARQILGLLLERFSDEKVFTDLVLRLFTGDEPTVTVREFCRKKFAAVPRPTVEARAWDLVTKHSRQSVYASDIRVWDMDGDGYLEFVVNKTHGLEGFDHNLKPLWTVKPARQVTYVDFRRKDENPLIFAYERQWQSAASMWLGLDGKLVDEVKYGREFEHGRLSSKPDMREFTYGRSGDNQVIATRRKVFLRDEDGNNIWTYPLGGIPKAKGSERGLWPGTPAAQDVRPVDLDGDGKDEFLVVVEKRDIGMGMTYYLMPAGGKVALVDNKGKAKWEQETGTVRRVSFLDCTGDGKKEVIVEGGGVKIISFDGKLLSEATPKGYGLGDYDGDGKVEVFLCASDGVTVQELDGTVLLRVEFPEGRDVAWGDVTGDGIPEMVAVTSDDLLIIGRNGKLLFSRDLRNQGMAGVLIVDTDNDGRNDIVAFGRHVDIYELVPVQAEAARRN